MEFEKIWQNIVNCEGQEFRTIREKPFSYRIKGNGIIPSRTNQIIPMSDIKKAAEIKNLSGPGMITNEVRGSSYLYAILSDPRIRLEDLN